MKNALTPDARLFAFATQVLHCSQARLAKAVGTSKSNMHRIIKGEAQPTQQHYAKLAQLTGYTPVELAQLMFHQPVKRKPNSKPYSPALPDYRNLSLRELSTVIGHFHIQLDALETKLTQRTHALMGARTCEEVRATARKEAAQKLQAAAELAAIARQTNAGTSLVAFADKQVATCQQELDAIDAEPATAAWKQAIEALELQQLANELECLRQLVALLTEQREALRASAQQAGPAPESPKADLVLPQQTNNNEKRVAASQPEQPVRPTPSEAPALRLPPAPPPDRPAAAVSQTIPIHNVRFAEPVFTMRTHRSLRYAWPPGAA